jgi:hypothetical protein
VFTYKGLTWLRAEEADAGDDSFSIDLERVPKTPKKKASKQVALIPWERVQDFREGEQRGRKDVETKFVRTKNDPRNVRDIKAFRWNVYIEYKRYRFAKTPCPLGYYVATIGIEFAPACHSLVMPSESETVSSRWQCQYGPIDRSNAVRRVSVDMVPPPKKYN